MNYSDIPDINMHFILSSKAHLLLLLPLVRKQEKHLWSIVNSLDVHQQMKWIIENMGYTHIHHTHVCAHTHKYINGGGLLSCRSETTKFVGK